MVSGNMLEDIREETVNFMKEAPVNISTDDEITNLRGENAFLRKQQFELKEKVVELEDKIRDLYRTIGAMQPPEGILDDSAKLDDTDGSDSEVASNKDDRRWVAFAPTSYGQIRVGAEVKFTRKRDVLTGQVKWVGCRPKGSSKQFIGVEAAEDLQDAEMCSDLWEGNTKRTALITLDKIIVAWDWEMRKL